MRYMSIWYKITKPRERHGTLYIDGLEENFAKTNTEMCLCENLKFVESVRTLRDESDKILSAFE